MSDVLVYTRYKNRVPAPPGQARSAYIEPVTETYTGSDFLTALVDERKVGLVVSNELGMPVELGAPSASAVAEEATDVPAWQLARTAYWLGDRGRIVAPGELEEEEDAEVLGPAAASELPLDVRDEGAGPGHRRAADVTWLRRTEYLSNAEKEFKPTAAGQVSLGLQAPGRGARGAGAGAGAGTAELHAQTSREDRIAQIEAGFAAANAPVGGIRHPKKPRARVARSYSLVPGAADAAGAAPLELVRFNEDPVEALRMETGDATQRLAHAFLRPVAMPDGDTRLTVYLPANEVPLREYDAERRSAAPAGDAYDFRALRDYEVASAQTLPGADLALSFADGRASYRVLGSAQLLRKRRIVRGETSEYPDELLEEGVQYWDGLSVRRVPLGAAE